MKINIRKENEIKRNKKEFNNIKILNYEFLKIKIKILSKKKLYRLY